MQKENTFTVLSKQIKPRYDIGKVVAVSDI